MSGIKKRGDALYVEFTEAVNLTGREIRLYDANGTIVHLAPRTSKQIKNHHGNAMIIVNSFTDGLVHGANPDNIVVPMPEVLGRNNTFVSKLQRPKDEAIVIFSSTHYDGSADEVYY